MDMMPHTIGLLYDSSLKQISRRVSEIGVPEHEQYVYDPLVNQSFIAAVRQNASGTFTTPSEYGRVTLYYRWIPSGNTEFLMVIGISANAVESMPGWLAIVYLTVIAWCIMVPIIDIARENREE
jgi:hypothetical protein